MEEFTNIALASTIRFLSFIIQYTQVSQTFQLTAHCSAIIKDMQIYPHYIKQTCIVSELANWTLLSEDRFLR